MRFIFLTINCFLLLKNKNNFSVILLVLIFLGCSGNADSDLVDLDNTFESNTDQNTQTDKPIPPNDVSEMKALFEKFEGISTSSDSNYFYISSNGLPSHNMMIGITNWQQQFPINQNYTGDNSWSVPINPEFSNEPMSSAENFMKGALAVAINGIPIFNPLNNRGEDANAIGELDQWGGHCGKADDYHYHLPPTHLTEIVGDDKPIAYSLDGFPVFGKTDKTLDENLGVLNEDGSYHYYSIDEYPYFIASMKGKVNTSGTAPENQIDPQSVATAIRPALTPLKNAVITNFTKKGVASYELEYKINSDTYVIDYSWDDTGHYYITFRSPDGTESTETYHR